MLRNPSPMTHVDITTKLQNEQWKDGLLRYIKKNTVIPNFLAKIKKDDPKIALLLAAIDKGDAEAAIFSDPECYFYVLYIILNDMIPFMRGITVYMHLIGLMQYTNKQALKESDQDVKKLRPYKITHLAKDGKLTKEGERYVRHACLRMAKAGRPINQNVFHQYVIKLHPVDQWLFNIPVFEGGHPNHEPHIDTIIVTLVNSTHFFIPSPDQDGKYCTAPSLTVINDFILPRTCMRPMRMLPTFGSINEKTLLNLHSDEYHPLALYARDVKSNPKDADRYRCGPMGVLLHDISHTYWANRFSYKDRKVIFDHYIPRLQSIYKETESIDSCTSMDINVLIERTIDFNNSSIVLAPEDELRLEKYLYNIIDSQFNLVYFCYRGADIDNGDANFIFLVYKLYATISPTKEDIRIWDKFIIPSLYKKTGDDYGLPEKYAQKAETRDILIKLARNAANPPPLSEHNDNDVDWQAWLDMLSTHKDSFFLWKKACHRLKELFILIDKYNLSFFHPYLPMTKEKQVEFKKFLERKIQSSSLTPPAEKQPLERKGLSI